MTTDINPYDEAFDSEYIKKQRAVWDDYSRGENDPSVLAKKHGILRKDAMQMVEEVKGYLKEHHNFQDMAKEALSKMTYTFEMIKREQWENVEELKNSDKGILAMSTALKNIAATEGQLQDALQKAGLYENDEMAEMMMESERKMEGVQQLLMEVIDKAPELKPMIIAGLIKIENPDHLDEPMDIDDV